MRPEVQSVSRAWGPRRFLSAGVVVAAVLGPVLPAAGQIHAVEVGPASVAEQDRAVFAALTLSVTGAAAVLRPPAAQPVCYPFRISYGDSRSTADRGDVWIVEGRDLDRQIEVGWFHVMVDANGMGVGGLAAFTNVVVAGDDEDEPDEAFVVSVGTGGSCPAGGTVPAFPFGTELGTGAVTIADDDATVPSVAAGASLRVFEPRAPEAVVVLELPLTGEAAEQYCYAYEIAVGRGTATVGTDLDYVSGGAGRFVTVRGSPLAVSRDVKLYGDGAVEGPETFYLDIFAGVSGSSCAVSPSAVPIAQVEVVIVDDDDPLPRVQPVALAVTETDADFVVLLELPLDGEAAAAVCYPFAVVAGRGTASLPADFRGGPGAFVAAAGETAARSRDLTIVGDDLVEDDETFFLEVYAGVSGTACTVPSGTVAVFTVQVLIVDDDEDAPGPGAGAFEVVETDADAVAVLQMELDGAASDTRCYPFRVAYARSTAGREDARLVEAGGLRDVEHGRFVVQAGSSMAVSSNLLVVGDDIVEGPESLHLDLYAPGPPGAGTCAPTGVPVRSVVVTIVDDDEVAGIASVEIDGGLDGLVREGDGGEREPVRVVVRFARRMTEPVTVRYGSVADGLARGAGPKQDVETVRERSARVEVGQIAVRLQVATVIGDDRVEAVEDFGVWVAVDRYAAETRLWLRVRIGNDDVAGDEVLAVTLEGVSGSAIVEGDPDTGGAAGACQTEWNCVLVSLSLTGGRLSEDVTYRVHTVPGSARPGEDYRFEEGIEVVLEEGHLRAFDLENPLRIEVRRDWFVEAPREDFYLVVHMLAGAETPLVSWFERIEIVDDDRIGGEGGALWFGAANEETLCPAGSRRFDLVEPAGGGAAPFRVDLVVAERAVAESGAEDDATCEVGTGRSVTEYRYELRSGSAALGADVVGQAAGTVRFVAGRGGLDVGVVGDGALEPAEALSLVLLAGSGPVAVFTLVVHDADSATEVAASRTAAAVRVGRVLASEVSDLLAERFSCAASAACAALGADPRAHLWPAGTGGRRLSPAVLLGRLMSVAGIGAGSAGLGSLAGRDGSSGVGTLASVFPGPAFSMAPASAGSAAGYGGGLSPDSLAVVGRALDGLRYQGDPGRWLGAVNIARGDQLPPRWTFWTRASYSEAEDAGATARRVRTSLLALSGGLDRQVGQLRVGVLYTHAFAGVETGVHGWAQPTVADTGRRPSAWRVTAPYVGWIPHRRFRIWASPGWAAGGEGPVLPADGLQAAMRMIVAGASVSVVASDVLTLDVEADVFEVDVERDRTSSDAFFGFGDDALSGRAQRSRLGGRLGVPLGDPSTTASRLTVRLGRRWDAGGDVDWVWGPIRPGAQWKGAGQVAGTDLLVDFRYRRARSSLSLVAAAGVQTGGEEPWIADEHVRRSSRRQVGFSAGLQWGAASSRAGWSGSVRPAYGHASLTPPGWWGAAVPSLSALGSFELVPLVDTEVAYGFGDGGSLGVSARQAFAGAGAGAGALGTVVTYGRAW